MYLCGEADGVLDLKLGPTVEFANGACVEISLSACSQQYVNASLFASVADPVRINAVDFGIV
jgi:hypothetical protein